MTENLYTNGEGAMAATNTPTTEFETRGNNKNNNLNTEVKGKKNPMSTFSDNMENFVTQK